MHGGENVCGVMFCNSNLPNGIHFTTPRAIQRVARRNLPSAVRGEIIFKTGRRM